MGHRRASRAADHRGMRDARLGRQRQLPRLNTRNDRPMSHSELHHLNKLLDRVERQLPGWSARTLRWLRAPSSRWVRIPLGILLVVGSLFSILPVFGLWMLPLGLLLLALDVPLLRRPTRRVILWLERRYVRWKRKRHAQP